MLGDKKYLLFIINFFYYNLGKNKNLTIFVGDFFFVVINS